MSDAKVGAATIYITDFYFVKKKMLLKEWNAKMRGWTEKL